MCTIETLHNDNYKETFRDSMKKSRENEIEYQHLVFEKRETS